MCVPSRKMTAGLGFQEVTTVHSVYRPLLFPQSAVGIPSWADLYRTMREHAHACEALRNIELALCAGQIEEAVLAGEELTRHCEDNEVLLAINISIVVALARQGDLLLAREHASSASSFAQQTLGLAHPLSVELLRWELHFMTFTLMPDVAKRKYPQLLSKAQETWGNQCAEYWYLRFEELIARSFERSDYHLAIQYTALQEQIEPILGKRHPLYLLTMLFLGHHRWEDGNRSEAKQALKTLSALLASPADICDETPFPEAINFYQGLSDMARQLREAYAHAATVNFQTLGKIWANLPDVPTLAAPEVEKQGTGLGKLT